jgi:tetratricopeptide (TPR) repeat protein
MHTPNPSDLEFGERSSRPAALCSSVLSPLAVMTLLASVTAALAAGPEVPDLQHARELIGEERFQEAYDLLLPFEAGSQRDVEFDLLLAEAALRTERAEQAKALFERVLANEPGSVAAHLGLGRAYLALGEYARAKIEFETVLRFDDLPADLQQQTQLYASAAQNYAEGRRLLAAGYGILGFGNYYTGTTGGGPQNDLYLSTRGGGNLNYELDDGYSINGSLDYRYANYFESQRRHDSDLRWNGAVSRNFGEGNLAVGSRGRLSYRGDGDYRIDYGLHGSWTYRVDDNDQFSAGAEIRDRRYMSGPQQDNSRTIAELTAGWTRSLLDGKVSVGLEANGGYQFNTERADGNAGFIGLTTTLNFSIIEGLGGNVFGLWQNDRFAFEHLGEYGDDVERIGTRNDNLYEVGGGLTWQFAPGWSLNPEVLYIHDDSNLESANYNSVEAWLAVRFDF